jgi:hypothetical protein
MCAQLPHRGSGVMPERLDARLASATCREGALEWLERRRLTASVVLAVAWLVAGCGAKAVTLEDLPVFPGTVELRTGETTVGDTLARNAEHDAAIRKAVGTGGSTRQRGFRLPAGATAPAVQAFYDETLKAAGWESGARGPAGGLVGQMLGAMMPADSPARHWGLTPFERGEGDGLTPGV